MATSLNLLTGIMNSLQKGTITELQCQLDFIKLGYIVSQPIAPCRYDFLVDIGDAILRIQCKTCHPTNNGDAIRFECRSTREVKSGEFAHRNYTSNEIDYFYTTWNGIGYLVPVTECSSSKCLRLVPPKNNQLNVNFACDYELKKTLERREGK